MDIPKIFLLAVTALLLSLVFIFFIYFIAMTILKFISETFGNSVKTKDFKKDIISSAGYNHDATDIIFHAPEE